jgi:hypothetical protein
LTTNTFSTISFGDQQKTSQNSIHLNFWLSCCSLRRGAGRNFVKLLQFPPPENWTDTTADLILAQLFVLVSPTQQQQQQQPDGLVIFVLIRGRL